MMRSRRVAFVAFLFLQIPVQGATAQTLGSPFGNPSKPATQAPDKEILNNDDFLDAEKTHYCKTINETCYVEQPGFIGNQCSCERNGRFSSGRFIKKGQLN